MAPRENTNVIKSVHFYDNLVSECDNQMLVCLAYDLYKQEKIKVIEQYRKSGMKEPKINSKMKEWQSTECHKVKLYVVQANEIYTKSMTIALEEPTKMLAVQHAQFKKDMRLFCPQKNKRRVEFFWSVASSFVSWVLTVLLIIIGWMAVTPKGTASKLLSIISGE